LRKRVTLFSGGAIRQHAHRVKRLLSPAGSDHNFLPCERPLAPEHQADVSDEFTSFGQAASSSESGCEMSHPGFNDIRAALFQCVEIFLCGGVIPHASIHGGCNDQWTA
jgi:hypothetical protein